MIFLFFFFFFQAEDGIRDLTVTGVQTCALPICAVTGALQFAARTHYRGLARWIAWTSTTCAVSLIVFSQAKTLGLCMAVLFVVGLAATSQMAASNTLIQNRVPDELRSRGMAV